MTPAKAFFYGPRWRQDLEADQTVWVYRISSPNWQQAVLTYDGMFSVVSDYGNYAYNWVNWGDRDFRSFFAKLSGDYLLGKIARSSDVFRQEETVKNLRELVLDRYRAAVLTKAQLRDVLGTLREADLESVEGVEDLFQQPLTEGGTVEQVLRCSAWDVICHGPEYSSDAVNYCKKLLPVLQRAVLEI